MPLEPRNWSTLESVLDDIKTAPTLDALFAAMRKTIGDFGFDHYSMAIMPLDQSLGRTPILNTDFPQEFVETYVRTEAFRFDPYLEIVARSVMPVMHKDVAPKYAADPRLHEVYSVGMDHKLVHGLTIPIPSAGMARGFSYWSTGTAREFEGRTEAYRPLLHLLAIHFSAAAESFGLVPRADQETSALSPREADCLRFSALGFTSPEIGEKLGITERTVRFHIANACEKLDAERRTEAVSRALRLGLIEF